MSEEPWRERILSPDAFGKLVEKHVSRMHKQGYFRNLSEKDLDHGHLVFRAGSPETFISLEDALAHTALVLYHTDESHVVWNNQHALDPRKRRQRSIVGLSDGILPAIKLFSTRYQDLDHYVCCGTIHVSDFAQFMPEQFEKDRHIRIVSRSGTKWTSNQFLIYKSATGHYRVAGTRYDIYFLR